MELPTCPLCNDGKLLPFSTDEKAYATWICSMPTCAYTIGSSMISQNYYKGLAKTNVKDKGDRQWTEFSF